VWNLGKPLARMNIINREKMLEISVLSRIHADSHICFVMHFDPAQESIMPYRQDLRLSSRRQKDSA